MTQRRSGEEGIRHKNTSILPEDKKIIKILAIKIKIITINLFYTALNQHLNLILWADFYEYREIIY